MKLLLHINLGTAFHRYGHTIVARNGSRAMVWIQVTIITEIDNSSGHTLVSSRNHKSKHTMHAINMKYNEIMYSTLKIEFNTYFFISHIPFILQGNLVLLHVITN